MWKPSPNFPLIQKLEAVGYRLLVATFGWDLEPWSLTDGVLAGEHG